MKNIYIILITLHLTSCKDIKSVPKSIDHSASINTLLEFRFQRILDYTLDSMSFPRSYSINTKKIHRVRSKNWTSGFFPGNLWLIYKLKGNIDFKEKADQWTRFIEKEKYNGKTHDMGFKVFCSFGEGMSITKDSTYYKQVILESAQTLITRFHKNVGCIRSWDFKKDVWEFPVIIDNMMNLELLFEATKISGDSIFHNIAVKHANTTLKNHFRYDNSSYHVVVYDTITGEPKDKVNHQGFSNSSSWSRGQAWGVYGYTMCYRYTQNISYLKQAEKIANFCIQHNNMSDNGIPYWDYDAPDIPNAPRDVSAATIMASAFVELSEYTHDTKYVNFSHKILKSLKSKDYILEESVDAPFILKHSTGNKPSELEVDQPLVYADYYFLETLTRLTKQQ